MFCRGVLWVTEGKRALRVGRVFLKWEEFWEKREEHVLFLLFLPLGGSFLSRNGFFFETKPKTKGPTNRVNAPSKCPGIHIARSLVSASTRRRLPCGRDAPRATTSSPANAGLRPRHRAREHFGKREKSQQRTRSPLSSFWREKHVKELELAMAPVVISGGELERMRKQVATAHIDTAQEVERNHLKHLSDERAAQWPNTISVRWCLNFCLCALLTSALLCRAGPILRSFSFL